MARGILWCGAYCGVGHIVARGILWSGAYCGAGHIVALIKSQGYLSHGHLPEAGHEIQIDRRMDDDGGRDP